MPCIHTLHILNKAPGHPRATACLSALRSDDSLLLTENAVLALPALEGYNLVAPVYALTSDAMARGLGPHAETATLVDYPAMVDLTVRAQHVISW